MQRGLTVAVTGPTGTFGHGLLPLLEADPSVGRVIGIARRPFDPGSMGWTKMTYRRGDVRDVDGLTEAFAGADVVVHLAFLITGTASAEVTRAVNIDGTLNTFDAAAAAGVERFVYSSSAAAYGFHRDNPAVIDETWPTRPDHRFFYAAEKAELEALLRDRALGHEEIGMYVLRPPIVLGPHALGAKDLLPEWLHRGLADQVRRVGTGTARRAARLLEASPLGIPLFLPAFPLQFIHESDVGTALMACIHGAGPPGAYNIAADGELTAHDVARELGFLPLPLPLGPAQRLARGVASVAEAPGAPQALGWAEALARPVIVDTSRARRLLGWAPGYSGWEALRSTIRSALDTSS